MEILIVLMVMQEVGGAKMDVSRVMVIVEMDKAQKVLGDAKASSQKAMDKSDIQKMLEKAKEVLGATVQCSSSEVTYEAK